MPIVLITGANGFIGCALCQRMVTDGWDVRVTVRSAERTANLPVGLETRIVRSIGPDTEWNDVLEGVNTVIHLAARVHQMRDSGGDTLAAYREVNTSGTAQLARAAADCGVKRLVYASTIKVNGPGSAAPYNEKDLPSPVEPYDISKWEAEQVLQMVANETGLDIVVMRFPLVYGPGVRANFLQLMNAVKRGMPLPLGNIRNRRSIIYLENLVDALVLTACHPKASRETFLVSDGRDLSTPELVNLIAAAMEKRVILLPVPPSILKILGTLLGKGGEVERLTTSLFADTSKIRSVLSWRPPFNTEEGIGKTVHWFNTLQ